MQRAGPGTQNENLSQGDIHVHQGLVAVEKNQPDCPGPPAPAGGKGPLAGGRAIRGPFKIAFKMKSSRYYSIAEHGKPQIIGLLIGS